MANRKPKPKQKPKPEQYLIHEIDGDRYTWFYVFPECRAQFMWKQQMCIHCKRRFNWNG